MTSPAAARRARRAQGQQLLDQLAVDYADRTRVDRAIMFGSTGMRVDGRFFAFVGNHGQLIVKVPAGRAAALMASGAATPVRVGRNPAREWIGLSRPASGEESDSWRALLLEAYRYVTTLHAAPR